MTAPALPRDDQSTEQVFDADLERHQDDDVRCSYDEHPASHIAYHDSCERRLCPACAKAAQTILDRAPTVALGMVECRICNVIIPASVCTVRPI